MVSNFVNNIISKKPSSSLQKNIQDFQIKWNDIIPPEVHSGLEKNRKKLDKLDIILNNIRKHFRKDTPEENRKRQRQAVIIYVYGSSNQQKKLHELTRKSMQAPTDQLNSMQLNNLSEEIINNSERKLKPCKNILSGATAAGGRYIPTNKTKKYIPRKNRKTRSK